MIGPVRLGAVGDIMLGELPACSGFGVNSAILENGPTFPFDHARTALADCDLLFGNLEVVISRFDRDRDAFESTIFRAQPEAAEGLEAAGFDVLSLATNHIMQHGREAVLETIQLLGERDIGCVGIEDRDLDLVNFLIRAVNGARVGFLAYNFRPPQYFVDLRIDVPGTEQRVEQDIEQCRGSVDWLVVSLHWGDEFVDRPSAEQVRQARRFVDAGADVILGHHPHIVQGVEKYQGRVIAYSLGDFVFDLWQPRLRESTILRMDLEDRSDIGYEIIPVRINRRWQPEVLDGPAAMVAKERLERRASLINPNLSEADYARLVAAQRHRFRREMRWHYLKNLHRFRSRDLLANLKRIVRGRIRLGAGTLPQNGVELGNSKET
jgi:gamma-polyglutamate biosynthesis protein CapA